MTQRHFRTLPLLARLLLFGFLALSPDGGKAQTSVNPGPADPVYVVNDSTAAIWVRWLSSNADLIRGALTSYFSNNLTQGDMTLLDVLDHALWGAYGGTGVIPELEAIHDWITDHDVSAWLSTNGWSDLVASVDEVNTWLSYIDSNVDRIEYYVEYHFTGSTQWPHLHSDVESILSEVEMLNLTQSNALDAISSGFNRVLQGLSAVEGATIAGNVSSSFLTNTTTSVNLPSDLAGDLPSMDDEVEVDDAMVPNLDADDLSVDYNATFSTSPRLLFWDNVYLGDSQNLIPRVEIDLSDEEYRDAFARFHDVSTFVWSLLYYCAMFWLIRREFVYYTSLGHQGGV